MAGRILVIVGPMFSKKTTQLLRVLEEQEAAGKVVNAISSSKDVRYGEGVICSHDKERRSATSAPTVGEALHEIRTSRRPSSETEVYGIDEGHFFPDVAKEAKKLADGGHFVVVAALASTFAREPFDGIAELLAQADEIVHKVAQCSRCGGDAPFSKRTVESQQVFLCAGKDAYEPRCRRCFDV